MGSISAPVAMGGLSALGGVAQGLIGSSASTKAAKVQASAAEYAAQLQQQEFQQVRAGLEPFQQMGALEAAGGQGLIGQGTTDITNAMGNLQRYTPVLMQPFSGKDLASTPGYQFALQQGLQATQNSAAAQGLGQSGAAQKAAGQYAQGLASTTYNQQFNNYLAQNAQRFNMLQGGVSAAGNEFGLGLNQLNTGMTSGINAASMTGQMGMQMAGNVGNALMAGGAAGASGAIGTANAIGGGINSALGGLSTAALMSQLSGSGMFGGGQQNPGGSYNYGNLS